MNNAGQVKVLRWPSESNTRDQLQQEGALRILIIEGGVSAPLCSDIREDWVRLPISRADLRARMAALVAKSDTQKLPSIAPSGALRFGEQIVVVSPLERALLEVLITGFRSLVPREELLRLLAERQACSNRNALDLHVMRIRRRIRPVGLALTTAWGRGYVLEPLTSTASV